MEEEKCFIQVKVLLTLKQLQNILRSKIEEQTSKKGKKQSSNTDETKSVLVWKRNHKKKKTEIAKNLERE